MIKGLGSLNLRRGLLVFAIEGVIVIALASVTWILAAVIASII